jgi:hypothetical protein
MAYIDCGRKIKQKQKTPLSQQFQFQISKEKSLREAKLIPLIHKCMTDHFSKESSR